MIYPKASLSSDSIKEVYHGRLDIRNVYRKVDGVMRHIFSADLAYFAVSTNQNAKPATSFMLWNSIVARSSFAPFRIMVPSTVSVQLYFHLYLPTRYAEKINLYIDGQYVYNPQIIGGQSLIIDRGDDTERSVPYTYLSVPLSSGTAVIESKQIKTFTQNRPLP